MPKADDQVPGDLGYLRDRSTLSVRAMSKSISLSVLAICTPPQKPSLPNPLELVVSETKMFYEHSID
jgi:hypothetical protein